ncbi:MAG: leucine-rich repeat domain-containing protein [Ruminococcaceae bacterium]|nr:leucine-rich repeat domain-containing protein [Oscillospiraceae bacterium]
MYYFTGTTKEGKTMSDNHEEKNIPLAAEGNEQAFSNSEDEYEAKITADGGVILTRYKGNAENVVIPAVWEGRPVVGLLETFNGNDEIKSVVIPDSVTAIGGHTFFDCGSLVYVTIPDSVTAIDEMAFESCSSLSSITIPDSVTHIGTFAFYGCRSLTSIIIPSGVTAIGEEAFYGCSSLTSINVDENNSFYKFVNGVLFTKDGKALIAYPNGIKGDYSIPDGVTHIGSYAFCGCSSLTAVTIPDSVTEIGEGAFSKCSGLTSVTIPDSVTIIGKVAFSGCYNLISVTIPDSVTAIGEGAFAGCYSLASVTIPASMTAIDNYVFSDCRSLKSVTIPASVVTIGDGAFFRCPKLTSVTIPDSVTAIGVWAFKNCKKLTVICPKNSFAWQYCKVEVNRLRRKPLKTVTPNTVAAPAKTKSHRWLIPLILALALLAGGAAVQLLGIFDILGWLVGLLG